jgi:hypothetical protein
VKRRHHVHRQPFDATADFTDDCAMIRERDCPMSRRRTIAAIVFGALFAGSAAAEPAPKPPGPAMMIHFDYYPKGRPQIRALEHKLASAIKQAGAGELGETEIHIDGNDGYLYMYGPDPDRLYRVTSPILKSSSLTNHSEVTQWYGSRTRTFVIR